MDNKPFKFLLKCIVFGIVTGTVLGVLGLLHIFDEDTFYSIVSGLIRLCAVLIVGIIDILCLWAAVFKPVIDKAIIKNGITAGGRIEKITAIVKPGQPNADKNSVKARFVYSVSYKANGKSFCKQYPPTCLTDRIELGRVLPNDEGEEIPIKHLKRFPSLSVIDNEILISAAKEERKESMIHFVMLPIISTVILITILILI